MSSKNILKKALLGIGTTAAALDSLTACPWINYQPKEPAFLTRMREERESAVTAKRVLNCNFKNGN